MRYFSVVVSTTVGRSATSSLQPLLLVQTRQQGLVTDSDVQNSSLDHCAHEYMQVSAEWRLKSSSPDLTRVEVREPGHSFRSSSHVSCKGDH
jgi:hypothetical protein